MIILPCGTQEVDHLIRPSRAFLQIDFSPSSPFARRRATVPSSNFPGEAPMRASAVTVAATFALAVIAASAVPARGQAPATGVTAFEGARLIVGNGSAPIENATLVIDGSRIAQVGRAADVRVPTGATRVSLAGKTVMPTIIDTHTHMSHTREALTLDLKHRAYYGVSAVMSLGQDTGGELLPMRSETIPGAARYFSAGRGIT